ncbi:MAG: type II toxin-antitoxin system RelE/ParE family toxin [Candidatus Micrarchaeota archaeon]|nr:type II toxin-antitoxin system RelE/ParE family toxin [Candidatus Micrarchaeota archaeon]
MFVVRLSNKAEKQFKQLEDKLHTKIIELFKTLENNPVPKEQYDLLKVGGEPDTYRIRLSSHRTVYRIFWQEKVIRIAKIERRTETTYK